MNPLMPLSVECYFDPVTELAVRNVWSGLQAAGVNSRTIDVGSLPHIALTVAEGEMSELGIACFEAFATSRRRIRISFGSVGLFPNQAGVMFLAPIATVELDQLHINWCVETKRLELAVWEHYQAKKWAPHCTLAIGLSSEQIPEAFHICKAFEFTVSAEICEIGLVKIRPIERVCTVALSSSDDTGSHPTAPKL
jgi:2'-5' RNA ligase